jgi:predicted transport protein
VATLRGGSASSTSATSAASARSSVELQHQRLLVYLALDPTAAQPWNGEMMRNARNIGHFGMGDTEYSLRNVDQLDELKALVQTAYDSRA